MSMRAQTLLPFTIISALIAIGTELLAVQSNREGGLALVHHPEDNTAATNFAYLFLPTIVAVFYSMIWSWVDLDVKRIQPWLELSATDGAPGKDSLFSEYPYNFIGFVPFSAAKRRSVDFLASGSNPRGPAWTGSSSGRHGGNLPRS